MDFFHGCLGDWDQALKLTDRYCINQQWVVGLGPISLPHKYDDPEIENVFFSFGPEAA